MQNGTSSLVPLQFYLSTTPLRAGTVNFTCPSLTVMLDASPNNTFGCFASNLTSACLGSSDVFIATTNVFPFKEREKAYVPSADHSRLNSPRLNVSFSLRSAINSLT